MGLNVYKVSFEFVKREAGSTDYHSTDIDNEETLVGAADFGSACDLAQTIAHEIISNRRFAHLVEIRVRDITLVHTGVRIS